MGWGWGRARGVGKGVGEGVVEGRGRGACGVCEKGVGEGVGEGVGDGQMAAGGARQRAMGTGDGGAREAEGGEAVAKQRE